MAQHCPNTAIGNPGVASHTVAPSSSSTPTAATALLDHDGRQFLHVDSLYALLSGLASVLGLFAPQDHRKDAAQSRNNEAHDPQDHD